MGARLRPRMSTRRSARRSAAEQQDETQQMKSTQGMWRHAALAAACLATAAHAADGTPSNYAGVQGGVNNLGGTWNANVSLGPGVTLPGVANTKRGTHFGVFGGRQTERARFELEWQHGSFDVTGLSRGPVSQSISSSGHYDAVTANAYRF